MSAVWTGVIIAGIGTANSIVEGRNAKKDAKSEERSASAEINKKKKLAAMSAQEMSQGGVASTISRPTLGAN